MFIGKLLVVCEEQGNCQLRPRLMNAPGVSSHSEPCVTVAEFRRSTDRHRGNNSFLLSLLSLAYVTVTAVDQVSISL